MGLNSGMGGGYWTNDGGGGSGSSADIRAPAIIVGNALAGDTADICDVLDPGDGSGIESALATAGANGQDVWIRPGTYDLELGSVLPPLKIPAGIKVRGAGRGVTIIAAQSTERTIATIAANAELTDVTCSWPAPDAEQANGGIGLEIIGDNAALRRVSADLSNVNNSTDSLTRFVEITDPGTSIHTGVVVEDCSGINAPSIGGSPPEGAIFVVFSAAGVTTPPVSGDPQVHFTRCVAGGGDYGFWLQQPGEAVDCYAYAQTQRSIQIEDTFYSKVIGGTYFPALNGTAITLHTSQWCVVMGATVPPQGSASSGRGILLQSAPLDNTIIGNTVGGNYAVGIDVQGSADRNYVLGNRNDSGYAVSTSADGSYIDQPYQRVIEVAGTARTLSDADQGATLRCTNAAGCAITAPPTLTLGFWCDVVQATGAGQVTFAASGTGSLEYDSTNFQAQTFAVGSHVVVSMQDDTAAAELIGLTGDLEPVP